MSDRYLTAAEAVRPWNGTRCLALVLAAVVVAHAEGPVDRIRLVTPTHSSEGVRYAATLFERQVEQRCPAKVVTSGGATLTVSLRIRPGIGAEGYSIRTKRRDEIEVAGNDERGLLYGLGKLLHTSRFSSEGFSPGAWRGQSVPACTVRGVYFATHFNNFYEAAPVEELQAYIEDLALWGINSIGFNFPQWQYESFDDPAARKNIERIRAMMKVARNVGMRVGLLEAENQGFKSAPPELRNVLFPDKWRRRGHLGTSLCPSKPGGRAYLMDFWNRLIDQFRDPGLDFIIYWPYDEGGCGCEQCWPWGARGHLELSCDISELARLKFPGCKFILSTWMYDTPPAGEWEGLTKALVNDMHLLDYILADAHEDFPRYPLDQGVPGGLPLLNYPEISMWGMSPWGGYGVNPLPTRLQLLWNQVGGRVAGGFTYSEGIYEDINKVIYSQFYWDPKQPARQTVNEYAAAHFSPDVARDVAEAVEIFEMNHRRGRDARFDRAPVDTERALELIEGADAKLTSQARQSWRWRLVYLRALIDHELYKTGSRLQGTTLRQAFDEIVRIYHAENVHTVRIAPPEMAKE